MVRPLRFPTLIFALLCSFCAGWIAVLSGAEVTIKVTDSLGRPVEGAMVELYWLRRGPTGEVQSVPLAKLRSTSDGQARGTYDESTVPEDEEVWADVAKEGYAGYSSSGVPEEFVLERKFVADDVPRIAKLPTEAQLSELRELLAGKLTPYGRLDELLFVHEHLVRPSLCKLLSDPKVLVQAGELLATIGVPEDIHTLLDHLPRNVSDREAKRLLNAIAAALLEPSTEQEWAFLRRCALDEFDAPWVVHTAIITLQLIAKPESLAILNEAARRETAHPRRFQRATAYIESTPPLPAHADLKSAGQLVARAISGGELDYPLEPLMNTAGDKALLHLEFIVGMESSEYLATFHRNDGMWRLRALRLRTMGTVIRR